MKFDLIALDKDFNIISLLAFTELQWNRKYYEAGTFSVTLPLGQYDTSIVFIYTRDRPEVGRISQINYSDRNGTRSVTLSGYFLEYELHRRIAYKKSTVTNITNAPTWVNATGHAETVAHKYFNAFKDVTFTKDGTTYNSYLGIDEATNQNRGHDSDHERDGSTLDKKIYTILKPSEMSYRIDCDFETKTKTFEVWKGIDRTHDNEELNNPIVFATKYGNIKNPSVVLSSTSYRNCYITEASYTENDVERVYVEAGCERTDSETESDDSFEYVSGASNRSDFESETAYIEALHAKGHVELQDHVKTIKVDFDAMQGSYTYKEDFDIGDKCSIEINEIGLSADAVLIGCYEVISKGVWTLELEFDTPTIKAGGI